MRGESSKFKKTEDGCAADRAYTPHTTVTSVCVGVRLNVKQTKKNHH